MRNVCFLSFIIIMFPLLVFSAEKGKDAISKDPFRDSYKGYIPDFVTNFRPPRDIQKYKNQMKLSTESSFYTLNLLSESDRVYALVEAALKKEADKQYREALQVYQQIIDKYSDALFRVSKHGVFVPVTQYCQRRILQFPKDALDFYRTKYDAPAEAAYTQALRKNSLEGLAKIRDIMLATSYGGTAMLKLGDAALDRGHYLEALEYFRAVRKYFPDKSLHTPELGLKITYALKMLGRKDTLDNSSMPGKTSISEESLSRLKNVVSNTLARTSVPYGQQASAPYVASNDYIHFIPTKDPLALTKPVWKFPLPASRNDSFIYTQPVVSKRSVIYRFKNVIYCRSILTGELRWANDLGGRVKWQNWHERQYPQEDVLVKDGIVFTPMYKVGPTLAAIDEITGSLKWAYGPMVASTQEEANMRFEAAPAAGPRTVYAGYVLDNIEGDTHIDSEYGIIAFESATGRIKWRKMVCRLRPGKFTAGFAVQRKNRIRSFISPPLYHQGTVYYCTNAGAIAALDALSGCIKWVVRYPYYGGIHDATRQFGRGGGPVQYTSFYVYPHSPMLWFNQRPLLIDEDIFFLPVDAPKMFKIDRNTGKINGSRNKNEGSPTDISTTYFLGRAKTGELVLANSFRWTYLPNPNKAGGIHLVDPKTGKTVWFLGDPVPVENHPILKYYIYQFLWAMGHQRWGYQVSARPFITADNKVYLSGVFQSGWPFYGWCMYLTEVSLDKRKITAQRRYLDGRTLTTLFQRIKDAPAQLKLLEEIPHKDKNLKWKIDELKLVIKSDDVLENRHGPFWPFLRITVKRFGKHFELRMSPKHIQMVYDRQNVKKAVAGRTDPDGLFARAELALGESRLLQASQLMKQCLSSLSSENLDMRAAVNQQLFKVYKRLAQNDIRAADTKQELAHCMGMRRTVSTLSEEIETIFALSDAYTRTKDYMKTIRQLQSIISTYDHYEYPISLLGLEKYSTLEKASYTILKKADSFIGKSIYTNELALAVRLMRKGLPLYMSTLSPLDKDLTIRAGDFAALKLIKLQNSDSGFKDAFHKEAGGKLTKNLSVEEQFHSLKKYPATPAGQNILNALFDRTSVELEKKAITFSQRASLRKRLWKLADTARVASLDIPGKFRGKVLSPRDIRPPAPLHPPYKDQEIDLSDKRGPAWMVLKRKDDCGTKPDLLFLGARVKKKFDNKFLLRCINMKDNKTLWDAQERRGPQWFDEIRLRGKGNEPGFLEAFVYGDLILIHGMYDVLAFALKDGKIRWRYRVPFDFEIIHMHMSGDILVMAGHAESIALYIPTDDPTGEVVWQEKEEGNLYGAPFFYRERYISLRKMPFNLTARYRSTGKLIGRLTLPDLLLNTNHPLFEKGFEKLPIAVHDRFVMVSDGIYYILLDVAGMEIVWKSLMGSNDMTQLPAMRFSLSGDYIAVIKENYDIKAIYMLSRKTGKVLWSTDPKTARPEPLYSIYIEGDTMYGLMPHPGQGFYMVARNCKNGSDLYRKEYKGYQARPEVMLWEHLFKGNTVTQIKDRQDFEIAVFSKKNGKRDFRIKKKGVGSFGEPGRVSAAIQNGKIILLSKDKLFICK